MYILPSLLFLSVCVLVTNVLGLFFYKIYWWEMFLVQRQRETLYQDDIEASMLFWAHSLNSSVMSSTFFHLCKLYCVFLPHDIFAFLPAATPVYVLYVLKYGGEGVFKGKWKPWCKLIHFPKRNTHFNVYMQNFKAWLKNVWRSSIMWSMLLRSWITGFACLFFSCLGQSSLITKLAFHSV